MCICMYSETPDSGHLRQGWKHLSTKDNQFPIVLINFQLASEKRATSDKAV